jgi:FAD:protein FMN transferase
MSSRSLPPDGSSADLSALPGKDPQPVERRGRREFLQGELLREVLREQQSQLADAVLNAAERPRPSRGPCLLLQTTAMACHFDVLLNPDGPEQQLAWASAALDLVHVLEQQLTVYRLDSELSQLNATAAGRPVVVEPELYALLRQAREISQTTEGAFDPTAGPLIRVWRNARQNGRLPTDNELHAAREIVGMELVHFDDRQQTVTFARDGVELNLGAIGKGYAIDRAAALLREHGLTDWLLHGGKSSILVGGGHAGWPGWPIGLRNPMRPEAEWGTLLLTDQALGTSGTAVQSFRVDGKRYGHVLDPRTGWPVEGMASASAVARTAAEADAFSTAFYVLGVEKACSLCDTRPDLAAVLFPEPQPGRGLAAVTFGIPNDRLFLAD